MHSGKAVVYVARYSWPFRVVAVAAVAMMAAFRPSVKGVWQSEGWFFGLGLVLAYLLVGLALLETFVRRTIFTEKSLYQRSMFGITRVIEYHQIHELVIQRGEALIVKSKNSPNLKIHAKEGDPDVIVDSLGKFLDPEVRVITA